MTWIPLHVHSQYSILDASASLPDLAKRGVEYGMKALALTDHGNLFGAVDFYKECKAAGIKPIIGCDFYEAPGSRHEKKRVAGFRPAYSIVLLAKNKQGYHNLCKLSSCGYLEGFYYYPRIDRDLLQQCAEGLVCLSSGSNGRIAQELHQGSKENCLEHIRWYHSLFGKDFYLELQRHPMQEEDLQADGMYREGWLIQKYHDYINKQNELNVFLLDISKSEGIPVVATNDSHYMDREDWQAHEILLNVQSGEPCEIWEKDSQGNPKFRIPNPKRDTYPSHEFYFKKPEQMQQLFCDIPEAISNSLAIAEKCQLELDFKSKHYPVYIPPSLQDKPHTKEEQQKAAEEYLWQLCRKGIEIRYTPERLAKVKEKYPDRDPIIVVRERLEYEMSVIVPKGMCDYLLIVWDFIHWAKSRGIPMGPGRGSGVGSIVLYLIGVTDIEPLRFNLFFERFINPERISYPDIDVDICMNRRNEVIHYTMQKYGKENVAQIITFGTMKAKSSLKDVGRVLSVPLSKVNAIAKLVPDDLNITLDKALEKDVELLQVYQSDEEARRIIDIGRKLEGSIRNTGIHAAGIIICGDPLTQHIPLCLAKDSDMAATQYSMKPVEMVGMLKIDFLGLKTLTSIQMCVDAVKAATGQVIDWTSLPLEDKPAFDLIKQGKTLGVFQIETGGMQDLAKQLQLDKFEEIIAVLSLYRPGPMDMIPSFIHRKHGRETIENDHPWMKEILEETYGIMVYQEQVMQIASKLANYTLGEGDVLRRAMGKKDKAEMTKQREKFSNGAKQNGIDETLAMQIFDKVEKFASYGFNKSHAAAYGYLTYVTAYLKANVPKEWMAALMTCDRDDLTKVARLIGECQEMGIPILPPDINEAGDSFAATAQGIRFAMSGIKGVGTAVVEAILEERKNKGPFTGLYQFCQRIDTRKVGKKCVESLIYAGCFDFTGWTRDALVASLEGMYAAAAQEQKEATLGIMTLFALMGVSNAERFAKPPKVAVSSPIQLLLKEKELLGFFVTGHPMDGYREILQRLSCVPLERIEELEEGAAFRAAFIVDEASVKISSKSQKKFAILTIGDGVLHYELPIWPDLYEEYAPLLQVNQLLYAVLQIEMKEGVRRLTCRWLGDLKQVDEAMVEACDRAFEKAKLSSDNRFTYRRDKGEGEQRHQKKGESVDTKEKKAEPSTLVLKVEVGQLRLSHFLALKEVFEKHPGPTPVQLQFIHQGKETALLHIDSQCGVSPSPEFHALIKECLPL